MSRTITLREREFRGGSRRIAVISNQHRGLLFSFPLDRRDLAERMAAELEATDEDQWGIVKQKFSELVTGKEWKHVERAKKPVLAVAQRDNPPAVAAKETPVATHREITDLLQNALHADDLFAAAQERADQLQQEAIAAWQKYNAAMKNSLGEMTMFFKAGGAK